ncbi:MAG: hypothetical protein IJT32_07620 [Lachnospiraceae bacterium]|nr:hypothetical protein [Lachnospiraceae bacterium]
MKAKILALLGICALSIGTIAGCGTAQETAAPPSAEEVETEATVGLANPWAEITQEEANEIVPRLFKAPEGAEAQSWMKCESLADSEKGVSPLVQLSFTLDGLELTARAQNGTAEDADISGNYVEWTTGPDEVTLANWGGGNMKGKVCRAVNDDGYVDQITWYDVEIGISYSLSAAAADLDGFDIQAVAEQMYAKENEPFSNMPDDFVQEQSGISSFDTYEDVIAALEPGQGYAYIRLTGDEEDILAVTDLVFEADHSSYTASLYAMRDGAAKQIGTASGNGSAFPLRLADGILYGGDNHTYESYFIASDNGNLIDQAYITDGINSGTSEITGFTRKTNSFDSEDFTGGQKELDRLLSERDAKPIIEFTMVK